LDPTENHCLAHSLRDAGYATAIYGKWHLGYRTAYNPVHHGFDHFRGYVSGNVDYHSHVDNSGVADWWHGLELVPEEGYVTDLVNRHAVDFIDAHRDVPFFLYVAHEAPHYPYQGRNDPAERPVGGKPQRDFAPWGSRTDPKEAYREMIEAMDEGIGWILAKLRECGLEEDTLVLFCSDNGAMTVVGSNGALRGEKGNLYEGGHRVPAVAAWPGRIAPGAVSHETVLSMDLLPTCLALAGDPRPAPQPLDGIDVSAVLLEQGRLPERDLFWAYRGDAAMRRGKWKLVRTEGTCELFDLEADLEEQNDLADCEPDLAAEMGQALADWEREVMDNVEIKA
jgi:arylsulfatase A-like enzyme